MSETNQPHAGETCSASRHVLAIAGDLARDGHCQHIVDEPAHCAESMLATVEALWAARNAARAIVAPASGMAEVERLIRRFSLVADEVSRNLIDISYLEEARDALLDYVRGVLAERDALIADNERLMQIAAQEVSAASQPVGAAWHLDETEASLLHHLTSPDDDGDYSPLTLRVGHVREDDGTVKFGLLCEYTEYPEEGATLLVERDPAPQPVSAAEVPMPERTGHFRNGKPRNEVCYCGKQMRDGQTCQMCGYTLHPQFMEVPMPDVAGELFDGKRVCDEADVRTYGDAREAAGYARGLAAVGWRDVADEPPKEAQEVLFVRGGKTIHGAWIGGIFWHNNQKMAAAKWMPLPAPQTEAALRGEVKP